MTVKMCIRDRYCIGLNIRWPHIQDDPRFLKVFYMKIKGLHIRQHLNFFTSCMRKIIKWIDMTTLKVVAL